ncbi:nucleotide exchange factor GrpE [Thermoflavimicrobium dichotomicum]|uniref:Molecular chaperone GrpE (Heat shock protein) n=1 Tax=Thermoflavimicrobium dichotomicum TaxID=46223 RepID=A0A1I3QQ81_9BACL|nr:nucleotide exchange factor GrpE [Thermoflavimicrobium dichotomicum]SFJ36294.1 Molecular chaperone GrpE (heat shock protein) [Thermoflavimicrobium dichotomicum]
MDPNKERKETTGHLVPHESRRMRFRMARDDMRQDRQQQQVLSFLSSLQANFSSLVRLIESRLKYDKTKEAAFERLYQEMDELKQDQELNQLRPLYIDLILLIDRMNNIYKEKVSSGSASPEITSLLESLSHELIEILYRRGVELIVCPSPRFDPKIQQVIRVIPTSNPQEDNLVVEVVRHGFKYKDVLLRPEEVVIKKYKP